jgi:hypothetical protein
MSSRLDCGSVGNEAANKLGSSLVSAASAYMYRGGAKAAPNIPWDSGDDQVSIRYKSG